MRGNSRAPGEGRSTEGRAEYWGKAEHRGNWPSQGTWWIVWKAWGPRTRAPGEGAELRYLVGRLRAEDPSTGGRVQVELLGGMVGRLGLRGMRTELKEMKLWK